MNRVAQRLCLCVFLAISAAILGVAKGDEQGRVKVFQLDGSLQCSSKPGVTLEAMAKPLRDANVQIFGQEKRRVPYMIPQMCNLPTGMANLYTIARRDWPVAERLHFQVWVFDAATAEVFKYDGTLQCGMGKEVTLDEMAQELTKAGIRMLSKRKGND